MPANLGMTEADIKKYIKRKLGDGIVKVELTEDHMDDIMRDSRRWFINRIGVEVFFPLAVSRGTTTYTLPDYVIDVYKVHLPSNSLAGITGEDDFSRQYGYLFGQWYTQSYGAGGTGMAPGQDQAPYSNLVQRLQMLETIGRLWGSDSDWSYNSRDRVLNIMPGPGVSGPAMLQVNSAMFDTTKLDPGDEDLFLRWAIADAKEQLGRNRSKYDSLPTVGGDRSLDGDTLLSEAQIEKENLERQALERTTDHATFILTG